MAPARGVQRYRCQACRQIFQTLRRGKDPAHKQLACQLYLEGMGMRAISRDLLFLQRNRLPHGSTMGAWEESFIDNR